MLRPENTPMSHAEVYRSDLNVVFWTDEEVVVDPSRAASKPIASFFPSTR